MKGVSGGIAIMKEQFTKHSSDELFALAYNWLYKKRRETIISKTEVGWLVQRDGVKLLCPSPKWVLQSGIGLRGFSDKFERFFKIEKGDVVLDVGACIGDTTVPMAIKTGPNGKVIAVEPDPLNVRYLRLNTAPFGNVEIIEKGIWQERGTIEFNLHKAPTGHSIVQASIDKTQIAVDTLDNLFSGQRIDFAKIDVQGAEIEVLGAAGNFLKSTPKIIVGTHSDSLHNAVWEVLKRYYPETRSVKNYIHAWR
jgi:FkbM family methyltransferase